MIVSRYIPINGKSYVEASDCDKILCELKHSNDRIAELEDKINNLRARCHKSAIDNFENGNYAGLFIVKADRLKNDDKVKELQCDLEKTYNQLMETEKEAQERISELESELEVKDNLLKIKNGLCGNDETKDKEPIEIAMDIIKGRNKDDLEQIAQHIQVYCRHTR